MAKWLPMQKTQLVIKVVRPGALAGLPVGKPGRGRLLIPSRDRAVAEQLVDSVVQQPLRNAGQSDSKVAKGGLPGQISDPDRARMELITPAVGLLLTGIAAFASQIMLAVLVRDEAFAVTLLFFSLWAMAFLTAGAVQ